MHKTFLTLWSKFIFMEFNFLLLNQKSFEPKLLAFFNLIRFSFSKISLNIISKIPLVLKHIFESLEHSKRVTLNGK